MEALQARRPTLRNPMPLFFDPKKPVWPNPELSIDHESPSINGLRCWQVKGPARVAMGTLSMPIAQLLDKHCESLEQGESKPRAMSFTMWMVGTSPRNASPTIIFSCKSRRQRVFAKALLKDSRLLDPYPGVKIKTLDKTPAVYYAGNIIDTNDDIENTLDDGIYLVNSPHGTCGALISFGQAKRATMGAVLLLDGSQYGITVQHARPDHCTGEPTSADCTESPCFDDDDEDEEDFGLVELTSTGMRCCPPPA